MPAYAYPGPRALWDDDPAEDHHDAALERVRVQLAAGLELRLRRLQQPAVRLEVLLDEIKQQTLEAAARGDLVRVGELAESGLDLAHAYHEKWI